MLGLFFFLRGTRCWGWEIRCVGCCTGPEAAFYFFPVQRGPSTFFSFPLHKKQKYWAAKGVGGETEMPDVPTEIAAAAGRWARPGAVIQQRGSSTRRRRGGKRCWMKPPQVFKALPRSSSGWIGFPEERLMLVGEPN